MGLNLEYDPWGLLGQILYSKHCKGLKAEVVMYDHTGAVLTKCDCGAVYWHDEGAYGDYLKGLEKLKEDGYINNLQ